MMPVLIGFVAVVGLLGATWAIQGNHFFLYQFFAPKYEQVRRETFEQSKAYRQGSVQELQNMQLEWAKATPEQRVALGSVIVQRTADFDPEAMPPDLRRFVAEVRRERAGR
jgi:hypothetical protein